MNETKQLAQFVADTSYADLPSAVLDRMRLYVLDVLACGLAGARRPEPTAVAAFAESARATGGCFVFGVPWTTSPSLATLANGTAIGALEADHGFLPGSCHPGAAVFPAALATAQTRSSDGRSFLTALVLGYEALCRIGLGATRSVEDERGFHGPGTNAAFGGAAAASKLLGLDQTGTVHALGIAGSHGGGLLEFREEGAMTKRLHVGRGSQMGLESALFAERGITGPSTVLEGRHGFYNAYSASPKPEELVKDLGREWRTMGLLVRPFPCHGSFHGVAQALDQFRREQAPKIEAITSLSIITSEATIARHGDQSPTSVMGMQYSLPFSAAVALARDIGDPREITEATVEDPAIRALAARIQLIGIPAGAGAGQYQSPHAEIDLALAGERHHLVVDGYRGHPSTPLTWDDIVDKLRRFAGPMLGDAGVQALVERVESLPDLDDVNGLVELLR